MIITNNPMVKQNLADSKPLLYLENGTYVDVLNAARDKIHMGHKLVTHPLAGSVKPGETPYKTVIVSDMAYKLDLTSLSLIESSICTAEKLMQYPRRNRDSMNSRLLEDFQLIDFSLIM